MGISAAALQREGLSLHVIIEANTAVMRRLLQSDLYRNRSDGHVVPVLGFWEEMVLVLGDDVFDGILLDPFPVGEWMPDGPEYQRPFMHHAHRMLKPGGVFTYMSGLSTTKEEIATTVNTDRTAALEAGFRAEDVKIDVEMHAMVDHCPAWPDCAKTMLPMLAPRLVKARSA
jgi:predicted methyltransferase